MSATGVLPAIDGHCHRLPKDWAAESMREMSRSDSHMRASDNQRSLSHNSMNLGVKITVDNDDRVDKALKSKVTQTTKLKGMLEESLAKTGVEISKMAAIKKYLEEQKMKVDSHLRQNVDRRGHRAARPGRELVHDTPHKELKRQTELLQDSGSKLESKIQDVSRSLEKLKTIKSSLTADLNDKAAALDLDNKCLEMVATDGTFGIPNMPDHGSTGLPFGWKKSTHQGVEDASDAHRMAAKLRKHAFHVTNRRRMMEKEQHDSLQAALSSKINEISKLRDVLTDNLSQVNEEIARATKVKQKLEASIAEKMPHLNLAKQRYNTRAKRPQREAIHDEVEHALLLQYKELKETVHDLQAKLQQVNLHLSQLAKTKAELEGNIADKSANLRMDQQCHTMAPSRPATSATFASENLSMRPPSTLSRSMEM
mmetsp:Transcript_4061/g.4636  ORF Transcript_4061/g.4636 Transcript_4061/m.4636 type:complete len:426 (-) Transcript_4061:553-1830(-)|eukprot:CAMPEP_0197847118 /NCGR_PEP_ID=MMETSP1438-20131217/5214_1 /TAXON_ID=1461541 /ORGANISM="Pterosperma sp., Strain CCMP1384" /LENGTH=425 /DNA_ID=CAMNT_0043458949 /DNA_START=120 /DNA_END=1397 /DNA_ORIENTATION=-